MHELSATQRVLTIALAEAAKAGAARVIRVNVKVGEWSTFDPECMRFYFDILARSTAAEGANLAVEIVPVRYSCADCGASYSPQAGIKVICPECLSGNTELISGREFYVDSIEVQ